MTQELLTQIRNILHAEHQASADLIISHVQGPIVFLIDEYHNLTDLIRDNTAITGTLIRDFNVTLIAVEGIEGDHISRLDLMSPDPDRCFGVSRLATAMCGDNRAEVVGVDSLEMFKQIEKDCSEGKFTAAAHPNQESRSKHMLQSLAQKLNARPRVSAAILTAGKRHVDDIETSLRAPGNQQDSATGPSFIRVRSRFLPVA